MQIRRLQVCDALIYRAFRLRALQEHPDAFTSSFEEENVRPLADSEKRLAAEGAEKFWGAFVEGEMAGMVGLDCETRAKCRHQAALVGMYVASEHAGQGLGRALVAAVLQGARASGVELVVLSVTDGNKAACALYTRAGFRTLGVQPDAIRVGGVSFGKQFMYLQLPPA